MIAILLTLMLRGSVLVVPPPSRGTIKHKGVTLTLTSTVSAVEALERPEHTLSKQEIRLCDADVVPGEKHYPFEFQLPPGTVESFVGHTFWVRHELRYTVHRPWYTFPITGRQIVVLLNRDRELPPGSDSAEVERAEEANRCSTATPRAPLTSRSWRRASTLIRFPSPPTRAGLGLSR